MITPPPGGIDGPCPDVSVIIVSWNVRDYLLHCISALLSNAVSGSLSLEIIVVDNASTDGTVQALRDVPVSVITNSNNLGYGRANNLGLRVAQGKHLLILNPDTLPQPGALTTLIDFAASHGRAGIIAPRLINPDGSVQQSAFMFPTLAMAAIDLFPLPDLVPGRIRAWLRNSGFNGRYPREATATKPFRIDHPLGACFLIRREAYEQCGGFDENIFMYSEEIDLAMRYADAGWESWQVPASRVVHFGGQSTRQMPDRMFLELWRSRLYVYTKHYSLVQLNLLRRLLRVAMLRDLAGTRVRKLLRIRRAKDSSMAKRARAVIRMVSRQ